jgi:hypothetical protein
MTLLVLLSLVACDDGRAEACIAAKDAARTAWGEVGVRYSLALTTAQDALKEPTGTLAALERRPDAPAEGKAVLSAQIASKQAEIDTLRPKAEAAQQIATTFASQKVADARVLADGLSADLSGDDVQNARAKAAEAAAACAGVE